VLAVQLAPAGYSHKVPIRLQSINTHLGHTHCSLLVFNVSSLATVQHQLVARVWPAGRRFGRGWRLGLP